MANDSELGRLVLDYKKSADKKIADLSAKVDALADKDDAVSDILLLVKDLQTEVIKISGSIANGIKVEDVRVEQKNQRNFTKRHTKPLRTPRASFLGNRQSIAL